MDGKGVYVCQRIWLGSGSSLRCGKPAVHWFVGLSRTLHPRCQECAIGWEEVEWIPREEVDAWLVMES